MQICRNDWDVCPENFIKILSYFIYMLIELLQGLITPLNQAKQVNQWINDKSGFKSFNNVIHSLFQQLVKSQEIWGIPWSMITFFVCWQQGYRDVYKWDAIIILPYSVVPSFPSHDGWKLANKTSKELCGCPWGLQYDRKIIIEQKIWINAGLLCKYTLGSPCTINSTSLSEQQPRLLLHKDVTQSGTFCKEH